MDRKVISAAIAAAVMGMPGMATANSQADMEEALRLLESQVSALKAQMAEMKDVQEKGSGVPEWVNSVEFSGVVEAEVVSQDNSGSTDDTTNVNLATFELGMETQISETVSAGAVLKYEDNATDTLTLDEATLTFTPELLQGAAFTIGKAGVPFSAFETMMASDPYTKTYGDYGNMRIVQLSTETESGVYGSATLFKQGSASDDEEAGLEIGYAAEGEDSSVDVAVAYVSSLDGISGMSDKSATNVRASLNMGSFSLIAEHLDGGSDSTANPEATNIELGYNFGLAGMYSTIAVGTREKKDSVATESKAQKDLAALTLGVAEGTSVILEYADEDIAGGTDNKQAIAKFVHEF